MTTRHATIGQRRSPVRSPLAPPSGRMPTGGAASSVRVADLLEVRRQDIEFSDIAPGRVGIAVRVANVGTRPAPASHALIQSAPLGAFVPWQTLTTLPVPALDPGESVVLRTEAPRATPRPLGPPDRLPPDRLLTALGFGDQEPAAAETSSRGRVRRALGLFQTFRRPRPQVDDDATGPPKLPPSPMDLLTGPSTYWAGNLNVFIGGKAVERHQARALRILPEHTNLVMFCVGDGHPDSYRFDLAGLGSGWDATLFDPMSTLSLWRALSEGKPISLGAWIPMQGASVIFLALRPPVNCQEANVDVHVAQLSTQKSTVVEFSFDAAAAGPGCYVVD
jgi:hypothetical protein